MPCVLLDNSEWIFVTYKLNVLTWLELQLLCMIFFFLPVLIFRLYFFHLAFLIIGSHIVFKSILGLLSRSCADSLRRLILQCSTLSIISILSHKGRWFPFSFHIWSTVPDFSELCLLHPLQLWLNIQRWDRSPTKSKKSALIIFIDFGLYHVTNMLS